MRVVLTGGNIDTTFLAKILARGLAKDGRLTKLTAIARERPGSIAKITRIAPDQQPHILDIHHVRTFTSAQFREVEVELLVEVRGRRVWLSGRVFPAVSSWVRSASRLV